MASPSTHLYPLLVPTAQPANTSSHSSLANALGPECVCHHLVDLFNGTARYQSLVSISGAQCLESHYVSRTDAPEISSRHRLLPQPVHVESPKPYGYQPGAEFSAIYFQRKGNKGPYSIGDLLTMDTLPDLVDGNAPLFALTPDRWIKIKLTWPGYARYPFEKRIPIKQGVPLTPTLVLMALASHIDEFVRWIHNEGAIVERGQEQWQVKKVLAGVPAMWKDCVIASLGTDIWYMIV